MTARTRKILKTGAISLGGLLAVLTGAGIFVARSAWFGNYVRERIVQAIESSTGGRAELGAFRFQWPQLRAVIRDFVLHGTEPPGAAPLFRAGEIDVQLRLSSLWERRRVELQSVTITQPQADVIVFPDGGANLPKPKRPRRSAKNALETIVDLAIGRFQIDNGSVHVAGRKIAFSAAGENLSAQLFYEPVRGDYRGRIAMSPLFVQSGSNPRLDVHVNLPLLLGRDRLELSDAVLTTPGSRLQINATLDHLRSPKISADVSGQIDLREAKRAAGLNLKLSAARDAPHVLWVDAAVHAQNESGWISKARLTLGNSSFDASGTFRNLMAMEGTVQFDSNLAVAELARMFQWPVEAGGSVRFAGSAVLNGTSNYTVDAGLNGENLSFRSGGVQVAEAVLRSHLTAAPRAIHVNPARVALLGGTVDARATIENFAHYRAEAAFRGFDLQRLAPEAGGRKPGYRGTVSGSVEAQGGLRGPQRAVETARARIAVAPGGRASGVPLRAKINARYDAPADSLDLDQSFIALPSSRVDLSGAVGRQMIVHFVSRNLDDFRPALAMASSRGSAPEMPVRFDPGGSAVMDATVTGKVSAPRIAGHAALSRFAVGQRHFDLLSADLSAQSNRVAVRGGLLARGPLKAQFQGSLGLHRWKTAPPEPLEASLSMRNADVMDLLALAGESQLPVRGGITLWAQASGTLGNPQGAADIAMRNGEAYGQPIDRLDGRVTFGGQLIAIPALQMTSGRSRVSVNATFQHPQNEFSSGKLRAHVEANQVTLARIGPVRQRCPDLDGEVQLDLDAEANLQPPSAAERFQLVSAGGTIGARMIRLRGEGLGDLAATIRTEGNALAYRIESDFAGSTIRASGRTGLAADHATTADLNIRNLPVEKALDAAGQRNLLGPGGRGVLSATGQVAGTLREPRATLDVTLAKAVLREQPVDRIQGHIDYADTMVHIPALSVQAGPNRLMAAASFMHPAQDFRAGSLKLHVDTNTLELAQIKALQQLRPGLAGALQMEVDGAATLDPHTSPRVMLTSLSAKVTGSGLRANGKDLGSFTLTARPAGSAVRIDFDSNLAESMLRLTGEAQLTRDYPLKAHLNFGNVRYSNVMALLGRADFDQSPNFDAVAEGSVEVNGPALVPADLTGSAQITKLEVTTSPTGALGSGAPVIALHNDGAIAAVATRSGIQVQRAHIAGPSTDIAVTGGAILHPSPQFNLNVTANSDLALIQQIDKNSSAAGAVALNMSIKGTPGRPTVTGRMELKNASYQRIDWPNGISNAKGAIVFTGNTARIESLTAESGGGKITATGNVTRTGSGLVFNLQSRATQVLVRTAAGVSVTANANVRLTGASQSSVLGGNVNIVRVGFNPQTDFAAILAQTSAPRETPIAPEGILANMTMDIVVRMAPGAVFQSAYTQGLQAQADLTLRGSVLNPGMIGRVNITQGNLVFFGAKYTINEGNVTFYNPYKIEPVLDLNLETTVQNVDVVLTVTGPVENMNLSYHSDPPLQFSDIVALLGAGKTPTSDPVLAANQPQAPPQSVTDMGASALLGAAVANPVAGQLQRLFGVSALKIAPTFVTGSTLPQAQVTLQQQVTPGVTFTYVTDLTQPDSQILRVEWSINPQWSAVASREINGLVGVDLFYKRRFR